jgi:hypothetical protein
VAVAGFTAPEGDPAVPQNRDWQAFFSESDIPSFAIDSSLKNSS